ncbi:MAG: zinc metallopeptidase [Pseudomonadota bacterium]|nr:zinc metallopeptidase [Pseudomonadota bacterium]
MIWLLLLAVLALLLLPGWWVKQVLRKHSGERADYPGTGGDMARHLLHKLGLEYVAVEATAMGDHYDPGARAVRLSEDKLNGRSLTAVVVAAHEVGHALQHARGETLFSSRTGLAVLALWMQRIAPLALLLTPLLAATAPGASRLSLLIAVGAMLIGTLVHLVTLPVEWDASFGKALPLLEQGEYLDARDMKHARRILTAAALTYVAASLMSLLNIGRWWRYLRR